MKKRYILIALTLGIGTALIFVGPLLINPPRTVAKASTGGIDVRFREPGAPKDLPSFDDHYQRHTGVLDVLRYYPPRSQEPVVSLYAFLAATRSVQMAASKFLRGVSYCHHCKYSLMFGVVTE